MRERLIEAVEGWLSPEFGDGDPLYAKIVDSVLEAMREPDPETLTAGFAGINWSQPLTDGDLSVAYTDMIDHIRAA